MFHVPCCLLFLLCLYVSLPGLHFDALAANPVLYNTYSVPNNAIITDKPAAVIHQDLLYVFVQGSGSSGQLYYFTWTPTIPGTNVGWSEARKWCSSQSSTYISGSPTATSDGSYIYVFWQDDTDNSLYMINTTAPLQPDSSPCWTFPQDVNGIRLSTFSPPASIYVPFGFNPFLMLVTQDSESFMQWSIYQSNIGAGWSPQRRVVTNANVSIRITGTASLFYDTSSQLVYAFHNDEANPNTPRVLRTAYNPKTNVWTSNVVTSPGNSYVPSSFNWIPRVATFGYSSVNGPLYLMMWPNGANSVVTDSTNAIDSSTWTRFDNNAAAQPGSSCSELVTWTYSGTQYLTCFIQGLNNWIWYVGYSALPACAAGQYLTGDICMPCPSGTYKSNTGFTSCIPCPAGLYATSTGSTVCSPCPSNTYRTSSTSCANCPSNAPYSLLGATKQSDCCLANTNNMKTITSSLKLIAATGLFLNSIRALQEAQAPVPQVLDELSKFIKLLGPIMSASTIEQQMEYLTSISPDCPHH